MALIDYQLFFALLNCIFHVSMQLINRLMPSLNRSMALIGQCWLFVARILLFVFCGANLIGQPASQPASQPAIWQPAIWHHECITRIHHASWVLGMNSLFILTNILPPICHERVRHGNGKTFQPYQSRSFFSAHRQFGSVSCNFDSKLRLICICDHSVI